MNDVFIERMVKKKMDTKDMVIVLLIILALLVLTFVGVFFLFPMTRMPMLPFILTLGGGFGAYKLITMRMLEFEYSLTNGFVSVDKIMNRSSRKRLISFECRDIEDMGDYQKNEARLKNRNVETRMFASKRSDGINSWYILVRGKKTGQTLLVFDPDEDLLAAVKKFMPSHLRFSLFGRK